MKKILLALLCVMTFTVSNAQSNNDIANVYIKRAQESLDNLEVDASLTHFTKAMKYMDTITSAKVAKLGTFIHYELRNFAEAQTMAKQYFLLSKNKKSTEYTEIIELFVNINEELEAQLAEEKRLEEERLRKEKELKRIDSLKTIWNNKSDALSIKVDSIYKFNKNNVALYSNKGSFGIIDDNGEILIKADEYIHAISYDGYILLLNKVEESNKIYCFNSNDRSGFDLPSPSDFNSLSTHYGKVMLPRGNGRLVTYPNNSYQPLVYDLNARKMVQISNKEALFKNLKKNDIIDKYNKEGEIKINKVWFDFGGHLGGGIHPLYSNKNYKVHSFLCSIDGKVLSSVSGYEYIGAFHNNKFQVYNDGKTTWVNQNGTKVSAPKDESGSYLGDSKVAKLENGSYQIKKGGVIVLGDEKLEKMIDFLRKFGNK